MYKSFREHFLECKENGTLVIEKCHWCNHQILTCKVYGGHCNSGKCREERTTPDPD